MVVVVQVVSVSLEVVVVAAIAPMGRKKDNDRITVFSSKDVAVRSDAEGNDANEWRFVLELECGAGGELAMGWRAL